MRSIARRLVIAASRDGAISMDWRASSKSMLATLDRREGGVWCADAAIILWRTLVEHGYSASIVKLGLRSPCDPCRRARAPRQRALLLRRLFRLRARALVRGVPSALHPHGLNRVEKQASNTALVFPQLRIWTMTYTGGAMQGRRPTSFPATCPAYFTVRPLRCGAAEPLGLGWNGTPGPGAAAREPVSVSVRRLRPAEPLCR